MLSQSDKRILSILLYVKGTTDRIDRILNKYNIRIIFKTPKKIGQILRNPKDQRLPLSSAGARYIKYLLPASKYTLEKLGKWSTYG